MFGILRKAVNALRRKTSDISLSYKLMAGFIIVTFIPIASLGVFSYFKINGIILNENVNSIATELNQIRQNINNTFDVCVEVSQSLYSNKELDNFLRNDYLNNVELFDAYTSILNPTVETVLINHKNISNIVLYTENRSILLESTNIAFISESDIERKFVSDIYKYRMVWKYTQTTGKKQVFSLYRLLNYFNISKPSDVIRIDINEDSLYSFIEEESRNKELFVIDDKGNVVTASHRDYIGRNLGSTDYIGKVLDAGESGYFYSKLNGSDNLVVYNTLSNKWKVIARVNTGTLIDRTRKVANIIIFVCAGVIIVILLLTKYLSGRLTMRISNSMKKMREIEKGNMDIVLEESGDEIGLLNHSFNTMIKRLNNLINENYISNLKKREAQIEALQSQINPHFLFNTLESIRMRLVKNGDKETAKVIRNLAKLFRTRLEFEDSMVTLMKEIELVEDYIRIQIYRFGDRVRFINDIDKKYNGYIIPKLTIQPLVENAMIHGIEGKEDGGEISLQAFERDGYFIISVTDTGTGMDIVTLKAVNDALSMNDKFSLHGSIGIVNVHERLRLYFGNDYGLKISSREGIGTEVSMYLPGGDRVVQDSNS